MHTLNDRSIETAGRQQVRQRAAMSEWINRKACSWRKIQVLPEPLMPFDQFIDQAIDMWTCFVCHHPTAGHNFESTSIYDLSQRSLLRRWCLIPPHLQEAHFGPHKCHFFILFHFRNYRVQNQSCIFFEIFIECLQPTGIVVREWYQNHLCKSKSIFKTNWMQNKKNRCSNIYPQIRRRCVYFDLLIMRLQWWIPELQKEHNRNKFSIRIFCAI